jgi:hypothetical protein
MTKPRPIFTWDQIDAAARTPEVPAHARTIEQLSEAWHCSVRVAEIRAKARVKRQELTRARVGKGFLYWPV